MYKEEFMDLAYKEALVARNEDEVPVGCVIVKDGVVIAKAHNNKEKKKDSTAHAEVECIKLASNNINNWHLDDCDLYVTLEPCMMCTGAIINSRIKNVYFAAKDNKGGALVSNVKINEIKNINHYPNIEYIQNVSCETLLTDYFKSKR